MVVGNSVFVGSCNGIVRAIEIASGRVHWSTGLSPPEVEKYFFHGDPTAIDGLIVLGADGW